MIGLLSFHIFHIQAVKLDQALAPYFGDPQEFINEGKTYCCIIYVKMARKKWHCLCYWTSSRGKQNDRVYQPVHYAQN